MLVGRSWAATRQSHAGIRERKPHATTSRSYAENFKMPRNRDADGIKSSLIINEVQKWPCLYDSNNSSYGDRGVKSRCWEDVCLNVVPGWAGLLLAEKIAAGKEVQKRWRSIRDSYTKAYRQGKCTPPELCAAGSRRHGYSRQMHFLLRALQTKKPRYSQDKYDSPSELSSSPQHAPNEDLAPKIKTEVIDKPLDLKTRPETPKDKPETMDKCSQSTIDKSSLEIKIDANMPSILPDAHFDDDRLFMNSLLPLFKKMNDDTRLLCRIEVLKIIRYALQGHKCFEALRKAEDSYFTTRLAIPKEEAVDTVNSTTSPKALESRLSMTTRSADGSRPVRKRKAPRSPSPLPVQAKRRGPGRPRKVRPPSDAEPPLPASPADDIEGATSVAQLTTPQFMRIYNLERSKPKPMAPALQTTIKTEPEELPS